MSCISTDRNPDTHIKIGSFWYPRQFDDLSGHHLLRHALRRHYENKAVTETYDCLIELRNFNLRDAFRIYDTFVKANGPRTVNIAAEVRDAAARAFGDAPGGQRNYARHMGAFNNRRARSALDNVRTALIEMTEADDIGLTVAGAFWKSPIFRAIHNWRENRFWRKWMPHRNVPAHRLAESGFQTAQAAKADAMQHTDQAAAMAALGVTQADWDDFLGNI